MRPAKWFSIKPISLSVLIAISFLSIFFTACASVPVVSREDEKSTLASVLPPECDLYGYAGVQANRDVIDALIEAFGFRHERIDEILNDTEYILLSVKEFGAENVSFSLVAVGRYPSTAISLGLGIDPEWERHRDGIPWYQSREQALQIGLPSTRLLLVASKGMKALAHKLTAPDMSMQMETQSGAFADFISSHAAGVDVLAYVPRMKAISSISGIPEGLLAGGVMAVAVSRPDDYAAQLYLLFEGPAVARVSAVALKVLSIQERRNNSDWITDETDVETEGTTVEFGPVYFRREALTGLITDMNKEAAGR